MGTFLFDALIFGPIDSRRLGQSLGVNLLPVSGKICNFNCLYCECGFNTSPTKKLVLPTRKEVSNALEKKLSQFRSKNKIIDTITFAGNGEPSLHPNFSEIIDDTITLRDNYFPEIKIAVLSNATLIGQTNVYDALNKIDLNILKLDSAIENTIKIINCPTGNFSLINLIDNLKKFKNNLVIQTLFLKGKFNSKTFDNTSHEELEQWLAILKILNPKLVMIYSLARDTPVESLEKIELLKLNEIARMVELAGIPVMVS